MAAAGKHKSRIRIIAGRFRGRKIPVPDLPGLRPSGDRVRETLFNWLQTEITGANCLDLFAGSGALGMEAASRGAGRVLLIDSKRVLIENLETLAADWKADSIELLHADALKWLADYRAGPAFDLVFVDPPFEQQLQQQVLERLAACGLVKAGGLVYVETAARDISVLPPADWQLEKDKTIGEVQLQLFRVPSQAG